jgi:peptidoglycan LD-endopeptidase LytH
MKGVLPLRNLLFFLVFLLTLSPLQTVRASEADPYKERMNLYHKMEAATVIPWYIFAGVDQYERNVRRARNDLPHEKGHIGIYFSPRQWVGPLNPNLNDTNSLTISTFGGIGRDGNGDGKADRENDEDILYTFAHHLQQYGTRLEDIKIGLWDYYHRDQAVSIIMNNAKIYKHFGKLELTDRAFPVALRANYSYRNTWGDRRGWGGLRIHEGTDIFANHGVAVKATTYGAVEMKGWNRYGGWRIGIRDLNNVYHYFAHLNGFEKNITKGTIVKPGDVIGYVGSSGYGPPGTSGKFPPHLHYGMYRDNGYKEWSFDPYPSLRAWEREEKQRLQRNRG